MTTLNRIPNTSNRWQGDAKKVLCVCSTGLLRSPTIANVLFEQYGYNTRAAGLLEEYALIVVDQALLAWADEVVCAEEYMVSSVKKILSSKHILYTEPTRFISLALPDQYGYMDDKLISLIRERYTPE